jgi:hypothetical protein
LKTNLRSNILQSFLIISITKITVRTFFYLAGEALNVACSQNYRASLKSWWVLVTTPSAFGCHPFTREGELPKRDVLIPLDAKKILTTRVTPLHFQRKWGGAGGGAETSKLSLIQ